jgi:hypothetical protein
MNEAHRWIRTPHDPLDPVSCRFYIAAVAVTGLRVDLLFDFPIPAAMLAEHATRTTIRSHLFEIASEPDLLRLKKIAKAARSAPGEVLSNGVRRFLPIAKVSRSVGSAR